MQKLCKNYAKIMQKIYKLFYFFPHKNRFKYSFLYMSNVYKVYMVKRYCPKCNMEFNRKSCYDYHINRKYDCSIKSNDDTESDISNIENSKPFQNIPKPFQNIPKLFQNIPQEQFFIKNTLNINNTLSNIKNNSELTKTENINFCCNFCSKLYSSKTNLNKHLKNCKIKKNIDNEKENIFKLLLEKDKQIEIEIYELKKQNKFFEKQNKILMDKIDKLIDIKDTSKSSKITNNSNNSNNINSNNINSNSNSNNTQNNFVMVNFGKEDLSIIDKKLFLDRIVKKNIISGVKIPDEVLKIIHFNPQYPQLSNIYISDINRDKCMVWEDGKWILSNIDNIPLIMDKICLFSQEQINNLREKYPNNKPLQDRLNTVEKYNCMIDNDYLETLKDDIDNDNKLMITRCEDFQKHTYDTIKKTLYNERKKIKKN